jgi:hypothetical protein
MNTKEDHAKKPLSRSLNIFNWTPCYKGIRLKAKAYQEPRLGLVWLVWYDWKVYSLWITAKWITVTRLYRPRIKRILTYSRRVFEVPVPLYWFSYEIPRIQRNLYIGQSPISDQNCWSQSNAFQPCISDSLGMCRSQNTNQLNVNCTQQNQLSFLAVLFTMSE